MNSEYFEELYDDKPRIQKLKKKKKNKLENTEDKRRAIKIRQEERQQERDNLMGQDF